jgi:hypothetical protein
MHCFNCNHPLNTPTSDTNLVCQKCAVKYRMTIVRDKVRLWLSGGSNTLVGLFDQATGEPQSLCLPSGLELPIDQWQLRRIQLEKESINV